MWVDRLSVGGHKKLCGWAWAEVLRNPVIDLPTDLLVPYLYLHTAPDPTITDKG